VAAIIYWLRKRIPDDLRPLPGNREEKFSLKFFDPADANILFVEAATEIETLCRTWAVVVHRSRKKASPVGLVAHLQ